MFGLSQAVRSGPRPAWDLLDFPVEEAPLVARASTGDLDAGAVAVVRTDRHVVLGRASPGYHLTRHRQLFAAVDDALRREGVIVRVDSAVGRDGAQARVSWGMDAPAVEGPGGERWLPHVTAVNSYDRSLAAAVVCGVVRARDWVSVRWLPREHRVRHREGADGGVEGLAREAMLGFAEVAREVESYMRKWSAVPYDAASLEAAARARLGKQAVRRVSERFSEAAPTLWSALVALSWEADRQALRGRDDRRLLDRETAGHVEAWRIVRGT